MAPALSALWGSGVAGEISGELAVVSTLTAFWAFLLLTVLLVLCAGCQGQKKASRLPGDHENLMNGVSEKETGSQTADTGSHGTDLVASSSFNGPLTSGTVLTDTVDTSPHPSEEMSIQSEHRSSKCPQDRELPSIPCANSLRVAAEASEECRVTGDGTYEVLKDGASHDAVEDSPYETVKELKEACLSNGTLTPDEPPTEQPNGHLSPSPGTPDLCPLADGAEYASIDLKKKSRYSVEAEAQRSAVEQPEEDNPPPIPDKVLDENDNQNITTLKNGELSAMYYTVDKPAMEEEKEHDYSSISEIRGMVVESSSSELYATVRDMYPSPPAEQPAENTDHGYETIKIAKSVEDEGQQDNGLVEPDYANVGELGLNSETSRL
ncbi:phosphoprotein associated with glycosphingolipid-enriched microdomains 1 [Pangasianodon hypophthalmus]|uniref:phosphoprotein associated with glycosphingolipid-enriched microdomains 1 n=1 Tax=Pangasianodon hypophthalmus TaxID=310915 RepID=UPI00230729F3|nr:phosphoprotein associated with glycosphingolipid-enriched microdomains 1 [Pangasianodon hypophthalmus]XP_026785501.3 phosphoprotein associated with glycosphingolipid-enriched microdomains 1 [Pangasianodon hypophthalmus]XP_026785503.3 phosphoprotein associated with glycosphingolipid-enriched microdomains 1 [Pangasianodon hypophthalmus]